MALYSHRLLTVETFQHKLTPTEVAELNALRTNIEICGRFFLAMCELLDRCGK